MIELQMAINELWISIVKLWTSIYGLWISIIGGFIRFWLSINVWYHSSHVNRFWRMGHGQVVSTLATAVGDETCLRDSGVRGSKLVFKLWSNSFIIGIYSTASTRRHVICLTHLNKKHNKQKQAQTKTKQSSYGSSGYKQPSGESLLFWTKSLLLPMSDTIQLVPFVLADESWLRNVPDSEVNVANMGPTGSWRSQVGPTLAPWILLSGVSLRFWGSSRFSSRGVLLPSLCWQKFLDGHTANTNYVDT